MRLFLFTIILLFVCISYSFRNRLIAHSKPALLSNTVLLDQSSPWNTIYQVKNLMHRSTSLYAANFPKSQGGKSCGTCQGKQGVNCVTCKGTGIDRVGGNVFERW